jgi:hypothetical protein
VVGDHAGCSAAAAARAHQEAAASNGAVDGAAAVPEPHAHPSSSSNVACSWCSPWDLYPAGMSAEEAVAVEHSPGLDAVQVGHDTLQLGSCVLLVTYDQ